MTADRPTLRRVENGNGCLLRLTVCPICGTSLENEGQDTIETARHIETHDWNDLVEARRRAGKPRRLTRLWNAETDSDSRQSLLASQ